SKVFTTRNYYFWIPIVADLLGGVAGAGLYRLCVEIHHPPLTRETYCIDELDDIRQGMKYEFHIFLYYKLERYQGLLSASQGIKTAGRSDRKTGIACGYVVYRAMVYM
ncbi:hypothetical protein G195_011699, partial [Phytophthora kernoviae 00238/432]